ncbi:hypothetical protein BDFB_002195 [Asbolus verrucosus]|uniref:Uncharacterized protein n=1 Tax=Asbolus verrucosus TaxID=1661398 RepID=A0A482VW80_ASBVE|nr:hypothetical protein BDFB_002195 [Asbolus verrucosus]
MRRPVKEGTSGAGTSVSVSERPYAVAQS